MDSTQSTEKGTFTSKIKDDVLEPSAPTLKPIKRRRPHEGWAKEMVERRKVTHDKLIKKRQKLTERIEFADPAITLHDMYRPPRKIDYTIEDNYQVASFNGTPLLYLQVCKQCKAVHLQDKSNYINLLRHLDLHNIEAGRPRKCKTYPKGKKWIKQTERSPLQVDQAHSSSTLTNDTRGERESETGHPLQSKRLIISDD